MMQAYDPDLEADCRLGDLSPTLVCRRRRDDALLLLGGIQGWWGWKQEEPGKKGTLMYRYSTVASEVLRY